MKFPEPMNKSYTEYWIPEWKFPKIQECWKMTWSAYYGAKETGSAFENLY